MEPKGTHKHNQNRKKKKIKKPLTTGGFDHECATSLLQPQ